MSDKSAKAYALLESNLPPLAVADCLTCGDTGVWFVNISGVIHNEAGLLLLTAIASDVDPIIAASSALKKFFKNEKPSEENESNFNQLVSLYPTIRISSKAQ